MLDKEIKRTCVLSSKHQNPLRGRSSLGGGLGRELLPLEFADHGDAFANADQMVHLHQFSLLPRQEMWYN
jgi:hypothetical protein